MSKRSKGKLASWNDDKGFGFIEPLSGRDSIFVHISAFVNRERRPEAGDVVTYGLSNDKQGRPCASKVTLPGDVLKSKAGRSRDVLAIMFALSFLGAVGLIAESGRIPVAVPAIYLALSLLTLIFYGFDKSAARRGAWRTSEATLHMLGIAGGWPGALIAQKLLRHKTRKTSFRSVFWVTVVLNLVALAWLFTGDGQAFFSQLPFTNG